MAFHEVQDLLVLVGLHAPGEVVYQVEAPPPLPGLPGLEVVQDAVLVYGDGREAQERVVELVVSGAPNLVACRASEHVEDLRWVEGHHWQLGLVVSGALEPVQYPEPVGIVLRSRQECVHSPDELPLSAVIGLELDGVSLHLLAVRHAHRQFTAQVLLKLQGCFQAARGKLYQPALGRLAAALAFFSLSGIFGLRYDGLRLGRCIQAPEACHRFGFAA